MLSGSSAEQFPCLCCSASCEQMTVFGQAEWRKLFMFDVSHVARMHHLASNYVARPATIYLHVDGRSLVSPSSFIPANIFTTQVSWNIRRKQYFDTSASVDSLSPSVSILQCFPFSSQASSLSCGNTCSYSR